SLTFCLTKRVRKCACVNSALFFRFLFVFFPPLSFSFFCRKKEKEIKNGKKKRRGKNEVLINVLVHLLCTN
ncbi:hypothetical protein WNX13_10790, partial [Lactobacillus delbrueckii]